MDNKTSFKTIEEFLYQSDRELVIPNYQRGYKWSVKYKDKNGGVTQSAVEKLLDDLIKTNKNQDYFLQGVTVSHEEKRITIIDGQQRTTTLYLLLWCLDRHRLSDITLSYDIREKSKDFIKKLKSENSFDYATFDIENRHQDIYYFIKAIEQIESKIKEITDKQGFIDFVLNRVKVLYIVISPEKATKTFAMMNGAKATMLQEELIKAEMLRKVSLPDIEERKISTSIDDNLDQIKEVISKDWETNALRSRYAREWDRWLYWWNREDVKIFFDIKNPMGLLLRYYFWIDQNDSNKIFNFENFSSLISKKQETKIRFKGLRDLQKSFEDIFNDTQIFNYLGAALINGKKFEVINYFIENKDDKAKLKHYAKWKLIGVTHKDIINDNKTSMEATATDIGIKLSQKYVYQDEDGKSSETKGYAYKLLLWLNVKELGVKHKFDFQVFDAKSLEHICPQHPNENDEKFIEQKNMIEKETNGVHSIGNLVLLNSSVNSGLSNGDLNYKRMYLFDKIKDGFFLPHTLRVFSRAFVSDNSNLFDNKTYWTAQDVKECTHYFIEQFKQDFGVSISEKEVK